MQIMFFRGINPRWTPYHAITQDAGIKLNCIFKGLQQTTVRYVNIRSIFHNEFLVTKQEVN